MTLSNFPRLLITISSTFSLVTISNFVSIEAANAFSINGGSGIVNGGFEDPILRAGATNTAPTNGWSTIGDVTTIVRDVVSANGAFVNPISGSDLAIITNAYNTRVDDVNSSNTALNFNRSGFDPVDADTDPDNHTGNDLQTFLNFNINDLSIDRTVATSDPRTSKEGSGMYQDFTVEITEVDINNGINGFEVSFNWAYLTNDGEDSDFGNQDYSFITIYDTNSVARDLEILGDSSQSITAPTADDNYNHGTTTFYTTGNTYTRKITGLEEGTYNYRVGFGVVDVDGSDRSSALLLDNFMVEEVPFEFTPSTGIGLVLGLIGINKLRRKYNSK